MKKKLTFKEIAEIYCKEIGYNIEYMEDYLVCVFNGKNTEEYDEKLKVDLANTTSIFFENNNKK